MATSFSKTARILLYKLSPYNNSSLSHRLWSLPWSHWETCLIPLRFGQCLIILLVSLDFVSQYPCCITHKQGLPVQVLISLEPSSPGSFSYPDMAPSLLEGQSSTWICCSWDLVVTLIPLPFLSSGTSFQFWPSFAIWPKPLPLFTRFFFQHARILRPDTLTCVKPAWVTDVLSNPYTPDTCLILSHLRDAGLKLSGAVEVGSEMQLAWSRNDFRDVRRLVMLMFLVLVAVIY